MEGLVRAPGQAELVVELGDMGQIRFNQTFNFLRAHCPLHGNTCMRQRTLVESSAPSRLGQGRPVGLLVDWLLKCDKFDSADSHKKMKVGKLADRREARNLVKQFPEHDVLFGVERDQRQGEEEEPTSIP